MKFFSVLALLAIIAQYTEAHQMLRSDSTNSVDFSDFSKPRDGKWDGKMRDGNRGGRHSRHPKGPINGKRHHGSHPSIDGGKNGKGRGKGERKTSRSDPTKEQSNE
ncbi:hypothetical protein PI125_g9757 [Phytophthora idaei]|nr:hypothetical protein PI125_g9757 [Phytophthora idaei]KAG3155948.1 hypothetical protein PI126_g8952 [Phytophthora idaei]